MATNLYEFYTGQGKALPTIQERGVIFEQQGLGKASDYKGTASQNTALLGKLDPNSFKGKTPTSSPTVLTSGSAKKAVDDAVAGIGSIQTAKPKTSADYGKELESIAPEYEDLAGDFIRQINDVRNGIIQYTPDEKAQLDFIQNSVIRARQAQEKFNRQAERGVRMLPTGEFAPVRGMSALNQTIQGGLDELKNIDLEGAAKLGEARQAIRDKRFDEIVKTYGELQGLLDKRTQVFKDLRDNAFNAEKFAYQQEQDARDYELKAKQVASSLATDALQRRKLETDILKLQYEFGGNLDLDAIASNPKSTSYINAMKNVSVGLPENQRDEGIKRMNQLIKTGDLKGAQELILRTAFEKLPSGKKEAAMDRAQAIAGLNAMKDILDKYRLKTGLVSGSFEDIARALGTTTSPDRAKFEQELTLAIQPYRSAITGAAWGPQENKEYKRIFPDLKNTNRLNSVIIYNMINALERNQGTEVGIYTGKREYNKIFMTPKNLQDIVDTKPELHGTINQMIDDGLSEEDIYQILTQEN